jgi:hypothetical protein
MKPRFWVACSCVVLFSWLLLESSSSGEPSVPAAEAAKLMGRLDEMMDLSDELFKNPMSLKHFIEWLDAKHKIAPLVNTAAFKAESEAEFPNGIEVYESMLQFPPLPQRMTIAGALRLALSQVRTGNATFVVRGGTLEITTKSQASTALALEQKVFGKFTKRALSDVVDDLAATSGVSIVIDERVGDKAKTPVSAMLRNDVSLEAALTMFADMAGLKIVILETGVYVTTLENAITMRKEEQKRQRDRDQRRSGVGTV